MKKIVLIGSTRFEEEFHKWNKKLTCMGYIVHTICTYPSVEGGKEWYTPIEKLTMDLVCLAKIEDSDAVLVLNKDNYIGDSVAEEIVWARMHNKVIYWLESNSRKADSDEYALHIK
jgi:hypothetical protein